MSKSIDISAQFYNNIKAIGLSKRTNKEWDKLIVNKLETLIDKNQSILDAGCGYGRITIPLRKKGYNIEGIDISKELISYAKEYSNKENIKINFTIGDICNLPYPDNSFDVVICMWSVFNELLFISEQIKAIKNIKNILKPNGWALFEGGLFRDPEFENFKNLEYYGYKNRIIKDIINGIRNDHYNHDKESLENLMHSCKISNYKIYIDKYAGRDRQILWFKKLD